MVCPDHSRLVHVPIMWTYIIFAEHYVHYVFCVSFLHSWFYFLFEQRTMSSKFAFFLFQRY